MTEPRIERLADILVDYSLDVQPGALVMISGSPLAARPPAYCMPGQAGRTGQGAPHRRRLPQGAGGRRAPHHQRRLA